MTAPFVTSYEAPEWIHFSDLKQMSLSASHYAARLEDTDEENDSAVKRFGRCTHAHLLGFGKDRIIVWKGERKGKPWTEFKEEFAENFDIVTMEENEMAHRCAEAVLADPVCGPLVRGGMFEREFEWKIGDRKAAGRIDIVNGSMRGLIGGYTRQDVDTVVDFKTTGCCEPRRYMYDARKLHYPGQVAFYADGLISLGYPIKRVYLIAVERKPPFAPTAFHMNESTLNYGRALNSLWFDRLLNCEASGVWPAYAQSAIEFEVPEELVIPDEGEDGADDGEAA
jgi:hypothetical protein